MNPDSTTAEPRTSVPRDAAEIKTPPVAKLSVEEAKRNFVEAMHSVDVLEPLRKHPYVVLGTAAAAGAVLGGSGKVVLGLSGLVHSATRLIKPLGGIVAQLVAAKLAANSAKQSEHSEEPAVSAPDDAGI